MASIKDVNRLFNGISLVAKEFLRRSEAFESGNFETLISKSLKKVVIAATDLSGLTKGKVKPFSNPIVASTSSSSNRDSVVYFDHDHVHKPDSDSLRDTSGAVAVEEVNAKQLDCSNQRERDADNVRVSVVEFESKSSVDEVIQSLPSLGVVDIVDRGLRREGKDCAAESSADRIEPQLLNAEENVESRQAEKVTTPVSGVIKRRKPRERRVPSTPFSRALGFAGLGAGLAWGTFEESAKRLVYGTGTTQGKQSAVSPFLSEKNAERLALALCRMRGAALKIGQMLSIQDESLVPAPILAALDIVRQGADVMPRSQLNQVLDAELGSDWPSKLTSFDYEPLASASIGQVHRAVMKDGTHVAMKIQYPGVADSIESDIDNVKLLLDYTNLIPKGLYLDSAMKVAKEELSRECDYVLEASNQKRFRDLLANKKGVYVPRVFEEISSKRVLTTELIKGIPIDKVSLLDQETRNYVGKTLLELTLTELFVFRFMQTDPNWGNFLYDEATRSINLIDFGAARDYPKSFVDDYLRMVLACSNGERDTVIEMSKRLGFLTGMESEVMLEAHVQAGFVVGLPFSKNGGYDFRATNIAQSISNLGATMLRHRLTAPPDEAYSLHRKLSGAFLACIKLGAVVPCRELLLEVYKPYRFGQDEGEVLSSGLLS